MLIGLKKKNTIMPDTTFASSVKPWGYGKVEPSNNLIHQILKCIATLFKFRRTQAFNTVCSQHLRWNTGQIFPKLLAGFIVISQSTISKKRNSLLDVLTTHKVD